MTRISESVVVRASLAETWDYYFEPGGWRSWVDQFAAVESLSNGYPEVGGVLRWRSGSAGRGEVTERVVEHEPRRLHLARWDDPESSGELRTTFGIKGEATEVSQDLDYTIRQGGPLSRITDFLFVRAQMRRSLERSLGRLRHEVEDLAAMRRAARPGAD